MGRKSILTGFWLLGFSMGFFGYLAYPGIIDFLIRAIPVVFSDKVVAGATISGIAGSIIMTVSIILWSRLTK